jgi:hypothetical protein
MRPPFFKLKMVPKHKMKFPTPPPAPIPPSMFLSLLALVDACVCVCGRVVWWDSSLASFIRRNVTSPYSKDSFHSRFTT